MVLKAVRGWRLFPCRTEVDRAVMAAHPPQPAGGTGCRWLLLAAEMAGLAAGSWRPPPEPAAMGWACPPRIATRALGAQAGSVRAARDFTVATLRRWGTAHSSQDIAIVVSEMVTNALRHALPGPGDTGPRRPVRLGLLQQGPWVLCAVADPGTAVPVPRTPGSLAEAGRGLQMICAFSDLWGYTTPGEAGKVVWAMFTARHAPPPDPAPGQARRDRCREQHAELCTTMWITCENARACAHIGEMLGIVLPGRAGDRAFTWESAIRALWMEKERELSTRHAAIAHK